MSLQDSGPHDPATKRRSVAHQPCCPRVGPPSSGPRRPQHCFRILLLWIRSHSRYKGFDLHAEHGPGILRLDRGACCGFLACRQQNGRHGISASLAPSLGSQDRLQGLCKVGFRSLQGKVFRILRKFDPTATKKSCTYPMLRCARMRLSSNHGSPGGGSL